MLEFTCCRIPCTTSVVSEDEDALYDDQTGRSAYCSEECYLEDCTEHSNSFNALRNLGFTYKVCDAASEEKLLAILKSKNPYIAHSFDEGDYDVYPGGWHWFWIPDLQDLSELAKAIDVEELAEIEYDEWEEFMAFSHPVKGIALIQAFDFLSSLSVSVFISQGELKTTQKPSHPDFQQ